VSDPEGLTPSLRRGLDEDGGDLAAVDAERQLAALQPQGLGAEQLVAPALEGGDVRLVLGGKAFEMIRIGDESGPGIPAEEVYAELYRIIDEAAAKA